MAKLTADTITDEQIRELRDGVGPRSVRRLAKVALNDAPTYLKVNVVRNARARCAEIINTRNEGDVCHHEWSVDEFGTRRCIGCGEPRT